ncbi:MAG: hypothetical protein FWD19_00030 [Defluviitaleaceae bacterium]|nr:hypothetical protein [Defluviitaleaceae bacterium]
MAYFDNPDNQAWWQNELDSLRTERERRKNMNKKENAASIENEPTRENEKNRETEKTRETEPTRDFETEFENEPIQNISQEKIPAREPITYQELENDTLSKTPVAAKTAEPPAMTKQPKTMRKQGR